jgi:hypothetical protein
MAEHAEIVGQLSPGPLTRAFQREIETQLAAKVPPGKRGALVTVINKDGAELSVAASLTDDGDWKLAGNVATQWDGDVSGKVILSGSW